MWRMRAKNIYMNFDQNMNVRECTTQDYGLESLNHGDVTLQSNA
mgnify:CR=1 FL=1